MKNIVKKLLCTILIVTFFVGFVPESPEVVSAKTNTFKKNGLIFAVIGKGDINEAVVIGVDDEADKESISTLTIPGEVIKNKKFYKVTKIESLAFSYVSGINVVIVDEGITEIGDAAFYKCADLTQVHILKTVSRIGKHCFGGCSKLDIVGISTESEYFSSENGIVYTKDGKSIICAPGASGDVSIKKGVEVIVGGAFDTNTKITSVSLPSSVKTIEEGAFYGCTGLKSINLKNTEKIGKEAFADSGLESVTIPASVKVIEGNPFMFCALLTDIVVSKKNTEFKSSKGLLLNASGKKLISGSAAQKGISIPSGVKVVGEFAFAGNEKIESIIFSSGIKKINEGAFCYCTSLKKIRFSSRKTQMIVPDDESYGVFFNTNYDLVAEVPYSEEGFKEGSIEKSIEANSPAGVDITTF